MQNMNKKLSMLIALFMVLMTASAGVSADGTDPLDGSDGGADWDGDTASPPCVATQQPSPHSGATRTFA